MNKVNKFFKPKFILRLNFILLKNLRCLTSLIVILIFNTSSGQDNTDFFNDYRKINFQFGVSRYTGAETTPLPSTLTNKYRNYTAPHFGFYYDIYHNNHFNFKIGITALLVREIREYRFDASELPNIDEERHFWVEDGGSWRYNLPLTVEYLPKLNFAKLSINSSIILGYSTDYGDGFSEYGIKSPQSTEFTTLNTVGGRRSAPWYANGQVGVGMYFPFRKFMLRTNVYYNMAFQKLFEGDFEFKNLADRPDTSGKFSFQGNSYGLELSIYLAKSSKKKL